MPEPQVQANSLSSSFVKDEPGPARKQGPSPSWLGSIHLRLEGINTASFMVTLECYIYYCGGFFFWFFFISVPVCFIQCTSLVLQKKKNCLCCPLLAPFPASNRMQESLLFKGEKKKDQSATQKNSETGDG